MDRDLLHVVLSVVMLGARQAVALYKHEKPLNTRWGEWPDGRETREYFALTQSSMYLKADSLSLCNNTAYSFQNIWPESTTVLFLVLEMRTSIQFGAKSLATTSLRITY